MPKSIWKNLFNFLSSLKLAVVVLVSLAFAMALGTIVESRYGAEEAARTVYHSRWFTLLMILLFLNVLFSALRRFPWKPRHIGFLVTHGGILIILIGTLITRYCGIEGRVALLEGESTRVMVLNNDVIHVHKTGSGKSFTFPIQGVPEQYSLPDSDMRLVVEESLENAEPVQEVEKVSGPEGAAVAEICFTMATGQEQRQWLSAASRETGAVRMGPIIVRLAEGFDIESIEQLHKQLKASEDSKKDKGILHVSLSDGVHHEVHVAEAMAGPVVLDGSFSVQVLNYYPHAQVKDGRLINAGDEPVNPALEVETVSSDGSKIIQKVFARFPEFAAMHTGADGEKPSLSLKYEFAPEDSHSEILLLISKNDQLNIIIPSPDGLQLINDYKPGEKLTTSMEGVDFSVKNFHPQATLELAWKEASSDGTPVVKVSLAQMENKVSAWLPYGYEPETVEFQGDVYRLSMGPEEVDLGFSIELIDFGKPTYGGTTMASQYFSHVRVKAPQGALEKTISMNRPLTMNGFRLFQSGFRELEDGRELTILSVSRDPGVPFVYGGFIVLIIGLVLTFYLPRGSKKGR